MKKNSFLNQLTIIFLNIGLLSQITFAQTIFYSQGNLDPGLLSSWNTNRSGGGTSPANFSTNNQQYLIQNSHTMTTTSSWSISGGSGVKLQIENGGTLEANYSVDLTSTGTFQIDDGGTYIHNNTSTASSTIFDGTENFSSNSNVEIRNWSSTGSSLTTQVTLPFGNLTINWSSNTGNWQWGLSGSVNLCAGNLNLASTGSGSVRLAADGGPNITLNGNLTISGGICDMSNGTGATSLYLGKNFEMSGGTITETGSGSGSIIFNGSSAQSFSQSSGSISNIINITLDNLNGLTLNNNLNINGNAILRMITGNIDLNSNTLTIGTGNTSSTIGSLSWSSGFIVGSGTLKRWIINSANISIGDSSGLFPLGSGNNNRNIWIGGTTTSSGGGTISTQHTDASGTSSISFSENSQDFVNRHNMNWTISTADGLHSSFNLSLRIQGSGISGINSVSDLNISSSTGAIGGSYSNPSGTVTDPQVNRTGLNETIISNTFYIAATSTSPLPVEINSFSATYYQNSIQIAWKTSTEVNNFGFEVQRSAVSSQRSANAGADSCKLNADGWIKIGFVKGFGNSNSPKDYTFVEEKLAGPGVYFYRLKQIDNDGKFEYSKVVSVNFNRSLEFQLEQNFPNPFNPVTSIRFTLPEGGSVLMKIYDALGREVKTILNEFMPAGVHSINISAGNLCSGIYYYEITAGRHNAIRKMIILK